jgi:hypothetical protein
MPNPFLSPDDLPAEVTEDDRILRRQLDETLTQRFGQLCDEFTKSLLSPCDWYVTTYANAVTLVINCPDSATNWRLLHHVQTLSTQLEPFSQSAKIRVCPPAGTGAPFEIRIDERSIYQDFS